MLKPPMPNLPGAGAVTDTLDFVKNLWGSMSIPGMGIPGMTVPSLSLDDLDKKIADLKAVEAWLNVNTAMLRGSIQALEVQRGTIATLKSMGATLANAVKQPGANEKTVMAAAPYVSAFFSHPPAEAPAPTPPAAPQPQERAEPESKAEARPDPIADTAAAAMTNPVIWWNMLQEQFKHAVNSAMAPEAPTPPADKPQAPAPGNADDPAAKAAPKRAPAKPRNGKNDA